MSRRPPSSPPALPGYEYEKLLGSGGFADVFLYRQLHPRQPVAIKVMLKERLDDVSARNFADEANHMAQLSAHPSIVSILAAGVADDGRPFLVMEYCSGSNLQVQHRVSPFSEARTLEIGVQIAGAVQTAHREGILHRDVKPANILVDRYGHYKLTDFGIASTAASEVAGLSIPWAPPEAFGGTTGPASDVYSLAATLYTLLTNRSPFEIPGAPNGELDVMTRIQTVPLPRTGRADVSDAFEEVLARAMAKSPADRYASATEFALALQHVQISLDLSPTKLDVEEEALLPHLDDEQEPPTRFRGVTNIDAQVTRPPSPGPGSHTHLVTFGSSPAVTDDTVRAVPGTVTPVFFESAPPVVRTTGTVAAPPPTIAEESAPAAVAPVATRTGPRWGIWVSVAVAAVAVAAVAIAVVIVPQSTPRAPSSAAPVQPQDAVPASAPPIVTDLTGRVADGTASFTWKNPAPETGDLYLWRPVVPGSQFPFTQTAQATASLPTEGGARACIEVVLRRADGRSASQSAEGCTP